MLPQLYLNVFGSVNVPEDVLYILCSCTYLQSTLISCECILMWVHLKSQSFFFNGPLWLTFHEENNISNAPQIKDFTTNKVVWKYFTLTHVYIIQAYTLKGYGTNCATIEKYLGCTFLRANMLRILFHLVAWVEFPF